MIREESCHCGTVIRANGSEKFETAVLQHFKEKHYEVLIRMKKLEGDANKEFNELQNKYPELLFSFSFFRIDPFKILEEKI